MKRIIAVILALTLAVTALSGCELIETVFPGDDKPVTTAQHEAEKEQNKPVEQEKTDEPEPESEPEPEPEAEYIISSEEAKKVFDTYLAGEWSNYFTYPVFWYNQFSDFKFEGFKITNQDGFKRFVKAYYEYTGDSMDKHYVDLQKSSDISVGADSLAYVENVMSSSHLKKLTEKGVITSNDQSKFNFQGGSYWYTLVKKSAFEQMADSFFGKGCGADITKGCDFVTETGYAAFAVGGIGGISESVSYIYDSVSCDKDKAYVKGSMIHEFNDLSNGSGTGTKIYLSDEITGEVKAVYSDYSKRPYKDYDSLFKTVANETLATFTMELYKDADGVHVKDIYGPYDSGDYYTVTAEPNLRVRSEPNTDCQKIGNLPPQFTVYVSEEKDGWGKVKYQGKDGWISLKYTNSDHDARH